MQKKNAFSKFLPHIIAIAIFLVISFAYLSPVLKGKELKQHDMLNHVGISKELVDYKESTDKNVGWTNSLFGGMPSYQIMGPKINNVMIPLSKPLTLWGFTFDVGIIFLYMLGFYVCMIALGVNPWLSIIAGISFALASYNIIIIEVGHITKAYAMSMIAPILASLILVFKKKYFTGTVLFIFCLALQLTFNHVQITYYTLIAAILVVLTYFIYSIKEKTIKSYFIGACFLLVGGIIALMPNSAHFMLNKEYVEHTMRGGSDITVKPKGDNQENNNKGLTIDYAYAWSYGIGESLTVLIPDARGGGSSDQRWEKNAENRIRVAQTTTPMQQNNPNVNQVMNQYVGASYWGEQPFTAGTVYFGAIIVFLSVLGLILVKGPERWWLLLATIISFILSWGSNFLVINEWLFYNLPFYNKFRAPSMILVLANVTMVILAILGLKEFLSEKIDVNKKKKSLFISGGIVGGLTLLCAILPDMFASFSASGDKVFEEMLGNNFIQGLFEDRKSMFASDSWRSFLFIAIAFSTMLLFVLNKLKKSIIVILIIGVAILIDLWGVDRRYLTEDNFTTTQERTYFPTPADEEIFKLNEQNKVDHYRVYNITVNTFNDASTSYFHPSLGGYHGAKLQRYQDIINFYMINKNYVQNDLSDTSKLNNSQIRQLYYQFKGQIMPVNMGVLNMLDAKYFILPIGENGQGVPIQNSEACGAAWFVPTIDWAKDANEEILKLDNFDPKQKAIIDIKFKDIAKQISSFDPSATIKLEKSIDKNPEYLKYKYNSKTDGIVVFSEIYYGEGWKAYIDGKEVPHFRANYILRGLNVPAGTHVIEFKFESQTLNKFNMVSVIGSILIVLLILIAIIYPFYKDNRNKKMK